MTHSTVDWVHQQLEEGGVFGLKLCGTITDQDGFVGLRFHTGFAKDQVVWILGDEEGNHPGAIEVTGIHKKDLT